MAEVVIATNPMMSFSIREDGYITVYAFGETGTEVRLLFNEPHLLDSASAAFEDAAHVLDMYNTEGFAEAAEYVNEGAEETEFTDTDFDKLLDS